MGFVQKRNQKTFESRKERALKIKDKLGEELTSKISKFIAGNFQNKSYDKMVYRISKKFHISISDSASCWYAWQIYRI